MKIYSNVYQLNCKVVDTIQGEIRSYKTLYESENVIDLLDRLHSILVHERNMGNKILMSDCKIFESKSEHKSVFYSIDCKPIPIICKFSKE